MAIDILNVGVDARPLRYPDSGIGRTTLNLLRILTESKHNWFLYSDSCLDPDLIAKENVTSRASTIKNRYLGIITAQVLFPIWAKRDQLDVFWSPRHHLPIFLSTKIKSIVTIHDLVWKSFPETMTTFGRIQEAILMPRAIASSTNVIAVSEFTKTEILRENPEVEEKLKVVCGASFFSSLEPYSERNSDALSPNKYFLYVGTFEPRKNLERLLCAFAAYLESTAAPLGLKIVGSHGWGKLALEQKLTELNLTTAIDLVGYVDDVELNEIYKYAYALLMPSLYEGFGLPVVEAMSHGVPAIVSKCGALEELGGGGVLLVDPLSIDDICCKMIALTENEVLRNRLGQAAFLRSKTYTWEKSAASMLGVIEFGS
jgi:glycosyltransferase involved in cell wall biosynthesis